MTNEYERRIELLNLDEVTTEKINHLMVEIGKEFPCLKCPSKNECENFEWFLKWFRDQK